jgi:enamine deaminase RidA (YjgF/YER057c/UK114 family)
MKSTKEDKVKSNRRNFLAKGGVAAAASAATAAAQGTSSEKLVKKVHRRPGQAAPAKAPLFNRAVSYGNLVFVSGIGAHYPGDIKQHTKTVLDELQAALEMAGSSMEKVLKVNVYLNDLKDYDGMNEVFRGRFGPEPGVRTTIAAAGGIPGNSLVEIDCIAYI